MNRYTLRHPTSTGDFSLSINASSPEEALEIAHSDEWADLSGETEVYDADDVPDPEDFVREEFPVEDAEPVLVVDIKPTVAVRNYRYESGEREGEWDCFEMGQII